VDDGYFVAFDGLCSIRKRWSSSEVPDTRLEDLRSCSSWTRNLEVRLTSYSVVGETKDEEVVEGTYDGYLVVLDSAGHLSGDPISDTKRGA